jgi:hypothetical protein
MKIIDQPIGLRFCAGALGVGGLVGRSLRGESDKCFGSVIGANPA